MIDEKLYPDIVDGERGLLLLVDRTNNLESYIFLKPPTEEDIKTKKCIKSKNITYYI